MNLVDINKITIPEGNAVKIEYGDNILWVPPVNPTISCVKSSSGYTITVTGISKELITNIYFGYGVKSGSYVIDKDIKLSYTTNGTTHIATYTNTVVTTYGYYGKLVYTDLYGNTKTIRDSH